MPVQCILLLECQTVAVALSMLSLVYQFILCYYEKTAVLEENAN